MPKKSTIVLSLLLAMIFLLTFITFASGFEENATDPLLHGDTGATELSPTAIVTYPLTGGMQMGSMSGTGIMTGTNSVACPMMGSGAMTGSSMGGGAMSGGNMTMPGMSGMGSASMQGMSGMGSMSTSGMSGMDSTSMQGMSGMGSMTMQGTMGNPNMSTAQMNDLMGYSFYRTNPWWVAGWLLVLVIFAGIIASVVIGAFFLYRHFRRSEPLPTAS